MDSKAVISRFLEQLLLEVMDLSASDVAKLEGGGYSLSVKVIKNKGAKDISSKVDTPKITNEELLERLRSLKSRDAGGELLSAHLKTKKELEEFARFLEIGIYKQDKAEDLRDKIIEATIGATLRSNAIQGKKV